MMRDHTIHTHSFALYLYRDYYKLAKRERERERDRERERERETERQRERERGVVQQHKPGPASHSLNFMIIK